MEREARCLFRNSLPLLSTNTVGDAGAERAAADLLALLLSESRSVSKRRTTSCGAGSGPTVHSTSKFAAPAASLKVSWPKAPCRRVTWESRGPTMSDVRGASGSASSCATFLFFEYFFSGLSFFFFPG